jgi:hypothetical protein
MTIEERDVVGLKSHFNLAAVSAKAFLSLGHA